MMTKQARAWWKGLEPAYKALSAILAAIGIGMAAMAWVIGGQAQVNAEAILENTETIEVNAASINQMRECMDTIKTDLSLVRCWVRADIEQTNPASCLVQGRRD